jgi:hypothetical protein
LKNVAIEDGSALDVSKSVKELPNVVKLLVSVKLVINKAFKLFFVYLQLFLVYDIIKLETNIYL